MIEKFINPISSIKRISIIEVFSNPDKENSFHYLVLERKKDIVNILQKGKSDTIESILTILSTKDPVILIFNNHSIIERIEPITSLSKEEFILSLYPNLNLNDFYYDLYKQSSSIHITLLRKENVTPFHSLLKEEGFTIIEIGLGSLSLNSIKSLLTDKTLFLSYKKIEIEHNEFTSISSTEIEANNTLIEISTSSIESCYLIPYAQGISFFSNQNQISLSNEKESFIYRTLYKRYFARILYGVLSILILNTCIFFYFHSKNKLIESQNIIKQQDIKEYHLLKQKIEKQQLLFNYLNFNKSTSTPIIDSIGNSVPNEIKLTELFYQPIIDDEERLETEKNTIIIKGNVFPVHHLTLWINQALKSIKQIKKIDLIQLKEYEYNAEFEITIETMTHD